MGTWQGSVWRPGVTGAVLTASSAVLLSSVSAAGHLERLGRHNFHGRSVSLRGGVSAALGTAGAAAAVALLGRGQDTAPNLLCAAGTGAVVASAASGAAGLVDDLDAGAHDGQAPAKGLRGHLGALAEGRVTTGALKIGAIGAGALVAGTLLARDRRSPGAGALCVAADAATSAVVIASWANLHNLLDLRPGRALKTAVLAGLPLATLPGAEAAATRALAGGVLGVAAASLPEDLAERTMLGDTGANAVGALVGAALAVHPRGAARAGAALMGTALVLASERVSFSSVIARTPVLSWLDALGRRAA